MSQNKKHHFVPKFYLRNFGNDKYVEAYLLHENLFIPRASIRGQCQKPDYYGKSSGAERALDQMEDVAAPIIKRAIDSCELPDFESNSYTDLIWFIMFQWARTPAAANATNALCNKMTKAMLLTDPNAPRLLVENIDCMEFEYENPVAVNMVQLANVAALILDLEAKILVNETNLEFITSDSPVVMFNQWCQHAGRGHNPGVSIQGLQIFVPLSPHRLLLMYDPSVYVVGKANSREVAVSRARDIVGLNGLQLLSADNVLYLSGNTSAHESIELLPRKWRLSRAEAAMVDIIPESPDSVLFHIHSDAGKARIDFSFMKVIRKMRVVPLPLRIGRRRIGAAAILEEIGDSPVEKYWSK